MKEPLALFGGSLAWTVLNVMTPWLDLGPLLLGLYLWGSLNVMRRHGNEAFSALRIQNYKNFLRFHITADRLTIYPVGVVKVPRKWKLRPKAAAGQSLFEAVDIPIVPQLIEPPIVVETKATKRSTTKK